MEFIEDVETAETEHWESEKGKERGSSSLLGRLEFLLRTVVWCRCVQALVEQGQGSAVLCVSHALGAGGGAWCQGVWSQLP